MLPWIIGMIAFIIGSGAAAAVVWIMLNSRLAAAIARTQSLDENNARLNEELNAARGEAREAIERKHEAERQLASLEQQLFLSLPVPLFYLMLSPFVGER
jgi:hypothetical protein